jgi:tetratricopeptide (TPR) repeat protein
MASVHGNLRSFLPVLFWVVACGPRLAGRPTAPVPPPAAVPVADPKGIPMIELEPLRIDVVKSAGGEEHRVYDARTLLEEGNDALMQRRYDEAITAFDHLIVDFPDSRLVVPALYNAGLALEGKRDFDGAIERYQRLVATVPRSSPDFVDAQFRLGSVLAERERYAESAQVFEAILDRTDLGPSDRVEALARLGFALLETQDYAGTEEVLRSALAYVQDIQTTTPLESDYFSAMCQFYLGEIAHRRFGHHPLRYPEEQLAHDIAQKSELFLLARDRFIKAVEYKNPYWATGAVYQIGAMYLEFWKEFMAVGIPANLSPEAAKEYVKLVNQNEELRRLLEKAILYHDRNITMAKNARVQSPWVDASVEAVDTVRQILARQQAGEVIMPGSREGAIAGPGDPAGSGETAPAPDYLPARTVL